MNLTHARFLASVGLAALVSLAYDVPARAQAVAPPLGTAGNYTVLGTNEIATGGTVICTYSTIEGDVGSTFGSITNTGPCIITGDIDAPVAPGVVTDFKDAYAALDDDVEYECDGVVPTATTTLTPGVYCSDAETTITGGAADPVIITLDGSADDVWIFRIGTGEAGGALTATDVVVTGQAQPCNVYWWTADAATMTRAVFAGTVLSGAAATMTNTSWEGRALATTDVTVTDSTITGCGEEAVPPVLEIPTLGPSARSPWRSSSPCSPAWGCSSSGRSPASRTGD